MFLLCICDPLLSTVQLCGPTVHNKTQNKSRKYSGSSRRLYGLKQWLATVSKTIQPIEYFVNYLCRSLFVLFYVLHYVVELVQYLWAVMRTDLTVPYCPSHFTVLFCTNSHMCLYQCQFNSFIRTTFHIWSQFCCPITTGISLRKTLKTPRSPHFRFFLFLCKCWVFLYKEQSMLQIIFILIAICEFCYNLQKRV